MLFFPFSNEHHHCHEQNGLYILWFCSETSKEQTSVFWCRGQPVNSKKRFRHRGGTALHLLLPTLRQADWRRTPSHEKLQLSQRIMTFAVIWRFRVVFEMAVLLSGSWSSDLPIERLTCHAKMYPRLSTETQLVFLLSYFAPTTLRVEFSETGTVLLYPGPL